jgi:hypothetical protein
MRKTIIVALARKLPSPCGVHDRRRRHRGGRDEGSVGDDLTPSAGTDQSCRIQVAEPK